MPGDSDWRKMLRSISGGVGKDILKEVKDKQKEQYPADRSLFSIKDWDTEFEVRNIINSRDLSDRGRRLIELVYARFREKQMTTFMQQNQDSLSTWAVLDQSDNENNGNSFKDITHFIWHFKYDLGPWMQGKLVEIIGPMRSGKNNFAVYVARAAMAHKVHVITSFPMFFPLTKDGPLKDFYKESHSLSDAMLYMVRVRQKEPEAIFFLMLDEQTTRGASKMRSNTIEAEWANGWIVRSGHFGCTTVRLMQSGGGTIQMQQELRYIEIYKNPRNINKAEGKFVLFGDEWPVMFQNIPDMTKYYNTASPGSWLWDIDPQAMNDYMAVHESEAGGNTSRIYQFYERYIRLFRKTDEPYWFSNRKYMHLDKDGPIDDDVGEVVLKEPLPVHHMNCPKLNGMIWTWTPKRYIPEGRWITCSKCKGRFKVTYSDNNNISKELTKFKRNDMVNGGISDHMSEGYRAIPDEGKNQDDSRDSTPGFDIPDEDPSETHDKNMDPFDPLNAPYVP